MQNDTRFMVSQVLFHLILTSIRWFWSEIHWRWTYTAPNISGKEKLWTHPWIKQRGTIHQILWSDNGLGLWQARSTLVHSMIRHQGSPNIQAWTHQNIKPTISTRSTKLWSISPPMNKEDNNFIMQITGTFIFHTRAVDSTMLPELSSLASEQSSPNEATIKWCKQFLDYVASQEKAVLTYQASDMILVMYSDALYFSESKARSRSGGHFFIAGNEDIPQNNGAVLNISQVIKSVMSLAAEVELGALLINEKQKYQFERHLLIC